MQAVDYLQSLGNYSEPIRIDINPEAIEASEEGYVSISTGGFIQENDLVFSATEVDYETPEHFGYSADFRGAEGLEGYSSGDFNLIARDGLCAGSLVVYSVGFQIFSLNSTTHLLFEEGDLEGTLCGNIEENVEEKASMAVQSCDNLNPKVRFVIVNFPPLVFGVLDVHEIIELRALLTIRQANCIWGNCGIDYRLGYAGITTLTMPLTIDMYDDLTTLSNESTVQTWRNDNNADLMVGIVPENYYQTGEALEKPAQKSTAYCIVELHGLTSKQYTGTHEITHLLGGHHEGLGEPYSGYTFKTGWLFNWKNRRTVMYASDKNKARIAHVSNPEVDFKGEPTGSYMSRTVDGIRENWSSIAQFEADDELDLNAELTIEPNPISLCEPERTASVEITCGSADYTYFWYLSINGVGMTPVPTSNRSSSINFTMPDPFTPFTIKSEITVRCLVVGDDGESMFLTKNAVHVCPFSNKSKMNEVSSDKASIYPSPATTEIFLDLNKFENDKRLQVEVFSLDGRKFYGYSFIKGNYGNRFRIDLKANNISNGSFLIKLTSDDRLLSDKIVIVK